MVDLAIAAIVVLIGGIWADGMKALERANQFARDLCARANLSLLDDTVALTARRWVRTSDGGWRMRRTYLFEYSCEPQSRASGFVILQGYQLASSGLASSPEQGIERCPDASGRQPFGER